MKLIKSERANLNYLARVVEIQNFEPHPNPEVTRMKVCQIPNTMYKICVGIDSEPGKYIYFPAGCTINSNFLSYCNLYRHSDKNSNTKKSGFFEDNGVVKAIKLKGFKSEGFIIQFNIFNNFLLSVINKSLDNVENGTEFDSVEEGSKSFWITKKYIIKNMVSSSRSKATGKQPKGMDKLVEGQFRFHYDTLKIQNAPFAIKPNDLIHLSSKWHGTSAISAKVICKRPLKWYERIIKLFDSDAKFYTYGNLWASRTVIKNRYYNKSVSDGFYGVDVWGIAHKIIEPHLTPGISVYYEIVGFLPNGGFIQKNYDYGCIPPTSIEDYTYNINYKIRVYRITHTDTEGNVFEYSTQQVKQWCTMHNIPCVEEFYYGYAKDLYPDILTDVHWSENFWERMSNDKNFYMEQNSPDCVNDVPHEGIVIKKDDGRSEAWKLKCFTFLGKEQTQTEANIEDNA